MKTQTIRDLLSTQPVLVGLDEGDLDLMAGCAASRSRIVADLIGVPRRSSPEPPR